MKKINLTIFAPVEKLANGINFNININDDATIIEVLSSLDKEHIENPEKSIFPLYEGLIHGYLQLIWDAEENKIYDDCGIDAYGPNREFMPLRNDVDFNLFPNSNVTITVHADGGADNMKERLDFGTFKRIIMKKYGKEHKTFAHYFKLKRNE